MSKTELFIGNLDRDVQQKDIEDVFEKYGKIIKCNIKNKDTGPSFCFLEFEDQKDAEEAVNGENGKELNGTEIHVEFAKSRDGGGFRGGRGGGGFRGGFRGGRDGDSRGGFRGGFRGGRDGDSRGGGFRGGRGGGGGGGGGRGCFQCGQDGHFARECPTGGGGGGRGGGGDRRRGGGGGGFGRGGSRPNRSRSPNNRNRDYD